MSFEDDMAGADALWDEQQEKASSSVRLPDGTYQATTKITRIEHPQWDESIWQLYVFWVDNGGEGSVSQWMTLDPTDEMGFGITAQNCKRLGYDGPLSGLREYVESGSMLNRVHEIKVTTKPGEKRDFTNVYINRYMGQASADGAPASEFVPATTDDDDIPF